MSFKAYDVTDKNGKKWTRLVTDDKYVDLLQPYSIKDLEIAIKLLKQKLEFKA